jgi:hypothetical protein
MAPPLIPRIEAVVAAVVLVVILVRQGRPRPFRLRFGLPIALTLLGLAEAASSAHPVAWPLLLSLAAGVGIGILRAKTVRVWREGSTTYRQGTWLTGVLWLVAAGFHLAVERAVYGGSATDLLYLGLSLLAQRIALAYRSGAGVPALPRE